MRTCCVLALLVGAGAAQARPIKVAPNRDWVAVVKVDGRPRSPGSYASAITSSSAAERL